MKRALIGLAAAMSVAGCSGSPEASNTPPKNDSKPSVSVAASEETKTPAPTGAAPTAPKKKNAEPPGLVLPDDEHDAVGSKGPDLPIR